MNKKTLLIILCSILFNASIIGQTYYSPGTGTVVRKLDFENATLLTEDFNYAGGWAGTGFGLSGTQRGAPEIINAIANPQIVAGSGNQVLAFRSQDRTEAWYLEQPEATGTTYYGNTDTTTQDDFFMYSDNWVAADKPSVMMHVYLPSTAHYTSLRMTVLYANGTKNTYPAIWNYGTYFNIRMPGYGAGQDIKVYSNAPNGGKDTWWTMGLSIAPDGDVQYYATPEFVTELTETHCLGFSSVMAPADGKNYNPVEQNNDAIIMTSNSNTSVNPTLFDRLYYTKGTQSLGVKDHKLPSFTIYPNPVTEYLILKDLKGSHNYSIINALGKELKEGTFSNNRIAVSNLTNGIYFLKIEGYSVVQFIKTY